MKWIKYIPEIIKALVITIPLIKILVEQFETPGFGEEKLKAVLDALKATLLGFGISEYVVELMGEAGTGIINAFVWIKNVVGEFTHKEEGAA